MLYPNMPPITHEYLTHFGSQAIERFGSRARYFESFSAKNVNRISIGMYGELVVHLIAVAQTTVRLVVELQEWVESRPQTGSELSDRIAQAGWDLAVQSLQNCVRIAEIDQSQKLIEIAYVIGEKVVSLAGFEVAKTIFEVAKALTDSKHLWSLLDAEQVTTGRFLLEFDLFAMTGLAAAQYAVAQVHALTRPRNLLDSSSISLEESGRIAMREAKELVVERVRDARQAAAAEGATFWVRFPEDGLWADAPTF
jgi:hypothetical protein